MSAIKSIKSLDMQRSIPILAILVEILWSFAWLIWLSSWPSLRWGVPPLNLISCIILGVGVEILTTVAYSGGWPVKRLRLVVLAGSLLLLLVLLRLNINGSYHVWDVGWFKF